MNKLKDVLELLYSNPEDLSNEELIWIMSNGNTAHSDNALFVFNSRKENK